MNTIRHELRTWFARLFGPGTNKLDGPHLPPEISTLLDSSLPGFPFRSRIKIERPAISTYDSSTAKLAQHYEELRASATAITRRFSVLHLAEAQAEIDLFLASRETIQGSALTGAGALIQLSVDHQSQEFAAQWERLRLEENIAAEQHRICLEQSAVLRDQILKDPAQARLWWLEGKRDRLKELVQMGDAFERLATLLAPSPASSFQTLTQQADAKANMLLALHVGLGAVTATQARWPQSTLADGVESQFLAAMVMAAALTYLLCFCVDGYLLLQVIRPRIGESVPGCFAIPPPRRPVRPARVRPASSSRYSRQAWYSAEAVARIAAAKYRFVGLAVSWTAAMVAAATLWICLGSFLS
ncbi:MAG: hypothetical protein QG608_648 [Actinomycetota bacterium]|nr:hypothetical protein [Actinomycetota bacterium]